MTKPTHAEEVARLSEALEAMTTLRERLALLRKLFGELEDAASLNVQIRHDDLAEDVARAAARVYEASTSYHVAVLRYRVIQSKVLQFAKE
jgi:hypothetical protein